MAEENMTDLFNMSRPEKERTHELVRELAIIGVADPNICFQCSKCTSGCEAMKLLELQPHAVMASVKSGFIEEILNSDLIWACIGCYKCKERCPQEVSPVEVMYVIKNWFVASGKPVPGDYQSMLQNMITKGFIQTPVKIIDGKNRTHDRESLGLPEMKGPENLARFTEVVSRLALEKLGR